MERISQLHLEHSVYFKKYKNPRINTARFDTWRAWWMRDNFRPLKIKAISFRFWIFSINQYIWESLAFFLIIHKLYWQRQTGYRNDIIFSRNKYTTLDRVSHAKSMTRDLLVCTWMPNPISEARCLFSETQMRNTVPAKQIRPVDLSPNSRVSLHSYLLN